MATGAVKWFDHSKGFGFITPEDGSEDVFVHCSTVDAAGIDRLNDGQRVRFEVDSGPRGPRVKPFSLVRA